MSGSVVVRAEAPTAFVRLLGLPGWKRCVLAAQAAGAERVWVRTVPEYEAVVQEGLRDPRVGVGVELGKGEGVEVPGDAAVDAAAVRGALAGRGWGEGVWVAPGATAAEKRAALLGSLANPHDGKVDTWLNRRISKRLTRWLAPAGVSPNAVTWASGLIGLAGAVGIGTGVWVWGVVGACLFQLSAAVDCVDGELARLTYRSSPWGARLDLVLDNVVHWALFAGMGCASVGWLGAGWAWGLGVSAVLGAMISFGLVYRWTFGAAPAGGRLKEVLDGMTNRDFSLGVVACAVLGWWPVFLGATAVGTHVFWAGLVWGTRE